MTLKLFVILSIWCQEKTTFKKKGKKLKKKKINISGYFIQRYIIFFFYFLCYNPQRDLLTSVFFFFRLQSKSQFTKQLTANAIFSFYCPYRMPPRQGYMTGFEFKVVLPLYRPSLPYYLSILGRRREKFITFSDGILGESESDELDRNSNTDRQFQIPSRFPRIFNR